MDFKTIAEYHNHLLEKYGSSKNAVSAISEVREEIMNYYRNHFHMSPQGAGREFGELMKRVREEQDPLTIAKGKHHIKGNSRGRPSNWTSSWSSWA